MIQQTQQEIKPYYEDVLNSLEENLNRKRGFSQEQFLSDLNTLRNSFNKDISTHFLRELIHGKSERQKTFKMAYLLNRVGISKTRQTKHFKEWKFEKYKAEITEYQHGKGLVYSSPCELSEEEQAQINEIRGIEEQTGVQLVPRALNNFNERQHKREAINRGLGVSVKDVKVQQVGKEFIGISHKVYYFLEGY